MARIISLLTLTLLLVATLPGTSALSGTIDVQFPEDGAWTNRSGKDFDFNFSYTDPDYDTAYCILWIDGAENNSLTAQNDTLESISPLSDFGEGDVAWNITCDNQYGSISTDNRVLHIDREAPLLFLPEAYIDEFGLNSDYWMINFLLTVNYTDTRSDTASCSLYFNGTLQDTISLNNWSSLAEYFLVPNDGGCYEWWVECTDLAGNIDRSQSYTINMIETEPLTITSPENKTYESPDDIRLTFEGGPPEDYVASYSYAVTDMEGNLVTGNASLGDTYYQVFIEIFPYLEGLVYNGTLNNTVLNITEFDNYNITLQIADVSSGTLTDCIIFTVGVPVDESIVIEAPDDVISETSTFVNVSLGEDADECNVSLDGGVNVTMNATSETEWFYFLTGLSQNDHELDVWCDLESGGLIHENKTFWVFTSDYRIIFGKPVNRTYWNTTKINVSLQTSRNTDICILKLDSLGTVPMEGLAETKWYYNLNNLAGGAHKINVTCTDQSGSDNSTAVIFSVYGYECKDNESGMCSGNEECVDNACTEIECTGCRYASNHTCVSHECCDDEDCLSDQYCASNICAFVICDCGEMEDHVCIEYDCCTDFDCMSKEECDTENHECVEKVLSILSPDSVTAGEDFSIVVMDHNNEVVPDAKVTIEYPSKNTVSGTTDSEGKVKFTAEETGSIKISVDKAGFESEVVFIEAEAGFNWMLVLAVILAVLLGCGGFFYWKQLPPVKLSKSVQGQNVTLKVKNRTGEQMDNVVIYDTVPTGAFISCGLSPSMENYGPETHLSWSASLNPGEEIVITYQSRTATENFLVKIGMDEYSSDFGFEKIMSSLFSRKGEPSSEEYEG